VAGGPGLAATIEELDELDGACGDDIRELLVQRARLDARISRCVASFDASRVWADDGARSAAAWLRHQCRLGESEAHRLVKTARQVREMPAVDDAWRAGTISSTHVDVIARARHAAKADDRFAEFEATFVEVAEAGTPDDVAKVAHQWRDALDAELDRDADGSRTERQYEARKLHVSKTLGGTWVIGGGGDPESGSIVNDAITAAYDKLHCAGDERSPAQQRWDALTHVCRMYLDGRSGGSNRPHLIVIGDEPTLDGDKVGVSETAGGTRLAPATLQRLACDAVITEATVDPRTSEVLDLGRARRTFTPAQYRALLTQYPTCVFSGCSVPADECYMHHLDWWTYDGRTDLPNGAPVCWHHHRLLHELRWTAERDRETGIVTWYRPDGERAGEAVPRRPPPDVPIRGSTGDLLRARLRDLVAPPIPAA
jgi:hypothetical protein